MKKLKLLYEWGEKKNPQSTVKLFDLVIFIKRQEKKVWPLNFWQGEQYNFGILSIFVTPPKNNFKILEQDNLKIYSFMFKL